MVVKGLVNVPAGKVVFTVAAGARRYGARYGGRGTGGR